MKTKIELSEMRNFLNRNFYKIEILKIENKK